MKNLIYQCYDGKLLPGAVYCVEQMQKYAKQIGAEYLFEANTRFGPKMGVSGGQAYYYNCLKPVYDTKFHEYDNVLYVDVDIFSVDGLTESIFDGFTAEVGNCTEPLQPKFRGTSTSSICRANDEKWATVVENHWGITMPRNEKGLLKVYNAGLELWSQRGLVKAHKAFVPFVDYINIIKSSGLPTFYNHDQNYFHAMMQVAKMDHIDLDNEWNCLIHHYMEGGERKLSDPRTENTKFVQIQIRSADHWDADTQWRITNLPLSEWNLK